ncbi:MobC family plasmid mobilization relaxosome protein [Bifidobacterium adolescentis]|uniref:MobC family plasmid mobilization relaxosome protein n=1 Tax=Bifidobacterium adolescentis TaxID=1680 RepID=UPI003A522745
MSWRDNRSRRICKKIMFSEDEWEQARRLYEELTRYAPEHRSFSSYARRMLSERRIHVTEIRPLTDPEPIAREIDRIGVNVNQIAHWANANEHITPAQVAEIRASFDRIERLLGDLFADRREARKDA